jgi:UDP-N-acetyl-D-galactosamine dehydrogenase
MVAAVGHRQFKERPTADFVQKLLPGGIVTDVKCMLDMTALATQGISVWRL